MYSSHTLVTLQKMQKKSLFCIFLITYLIYIPPPLHIHTYRLSHHRTATHVSKANKSPVHHL